jgi:PPM family protein phosphatase
MNGSSHFAESSMRWEQKVEFAAKTDVGLRRQNNEDACVAQLAANFDLWHQRGHLFVVADGMGGHAVGELASKIAIDTLPHTFFKVNDHPVEKALRAAIVEANQNINRRGTQNRDFQRMGTTCTSLVLCEDGAYVGHVGDSRAYRVRRDRVDQLTFDHSLQWELRRRGRLSAEDTALQRHANIITRSLGPEAKVDVDLEGPFPVLPDDVFVVCSDGLTAHVSDGEIAAITRDLKPGDACRLLVHLANLRGGTDNCTVVVVRVGPLPGNVLPEELADDGDEAPLPHVPVELSWRWMLAFWVVAAVMISGMTLWMFGYSTPGIALSATGAIAGAALLIGARKARRQIGSQPPEPVDEQRESSGPYRSAIARPLEELLDELAAAGSEIQRTAREDAWSVDWSRYEEAVKRARHALTQQRRTLALREYGKAIDTLLSGDQKQGVKA